MSVNPPPDISLSVVNVKIKVAKAIQIFALYWTQSLFSDVKLLVSGLDCKRKLHYNRCKITKEHNVDALALIFKDKL